MKLYIETSVPNFLFTKDAPEKRILTQKFFQIELNKHNAFISDLVIEEIEQSPEERELQLKEIIKKHKIELLNKNQECEDLASKYIKAGIIPEKFRNDALHIAIAVVNDMDIIVSWNMQHIVKVKTIVGVNQIHKKLGYREILINTPEEV
jgi:predicted nucleic acid-binding protein